MYPIPGKRKTFVHHEKWSNDVLKVASFPNDGHLERLLGGYSPRAARKTNRQENKSAASPIRRAINTTCAFHDPMPR